MHAKNYLAIVASAALAQSAVALDSHRHAHQHRHAKKDVVFLETDYETVTAWTTITVIDGEEPTASVFAPGVHKEVFSTASSSTTSTSTTSTSTSTTPTSTSTSVAPPPPATTSTTAVAVVPTPTLQVEVAAVSTPAAAPPAAVESTTAAAQAATTSAAASTVSTGGNKRGAAYNDASLISPLTGDGTKISWCYNWGQTSDDAPSTLEYVPMLWGPTHASTWSANAQAAISSGAKNLLSFNEPDNTGQSNLDPATAASLHQQYMNPFSGSARIGAPAITNSNAADAGINWLKSWVSDCGGACDFDFCPIHWYSPPDTTDFLNHLLDAWDACEKKPIWITEFAPTGDDTTINNFLIDVQDQMDNNATFSFVERYSYFMVSDGVLLDGTTPTLYGQTFAYGA